MEFVSGQSSTVASLVARHGDKGPVWCSGCAPPWQATSPSLNPWGWLRCTPRVGVGLPALADGPPCVAGGDTHPRQEEERGAEQRPGGHEESGSQEGLNPRSLHKKAFSGTWGIPSGPSAQSPLLPPSFLGHRGVGMWQ